MQLHSCDRRIPRPIQQRALPPSRNIHDCTFSTSAMMTAAGWCWSVESGQLRPAAQPAGVLAANQGRYEQARPVGTVHLDDSHTARAPTGCRPASTPRSMPTNAT
jgi:hypothetical protein